eukprot:588167-Alexandrium_andersonii.AAC.1
MQKARKMPKLPKVPKVLKANQTAENRFRVRETAFGALHHYCSTIRADREDEKSPEAKDTWDPHDDS